MREIKFRFWSINTKEMISSEFINENHAYKYLTNESQERDYIIPMQQTDIKDSKGNYIYEGDIIKIPDDWDTYGMNAGEVYEIFFNAGGFRCKPKINPNARGIWLEDDGEFEIIGNIYENPELI